MTQCDGHVRGAGVTISRSQTHVGQHLHLPRSQAAGWDGCWTTWREHPAPKTADAEPHFVTDVILGSLP
jgi:hypothetical protein